MGSELVFSGDTGRTWQVQNNWPGAKKSRLQCRVHGTENAEDSD